jgi:probable rRNA maturation factor
MNIVIANHQRVRKINVRLLKKIILTLLAKLEVTKVDLEINLVAATEMARINETYLRHDGATDVITFDYSMSGCRAPDVEQQLHGELFICVDEAILQARKFGVKWQSEIVRYIVHGILHLLGFDDARTGQQRKMKREENRLLRMVAGQFSLAQLAAATRIVV